METPNLDNWDDFAGVYLKPENVKVFPIVIVPVGIAAEYKENKPKVSISFQFEGKDRKMGLNKTNLDFIKREGLMPRAIIGKKLTFNKIKVRNPTLNVMVDSFILEKIE